MTFPESVRPENTAFEWQNNTATMMTLSGDGALNVATPPNTQTDSYTLVSGDAGKLVNMNSASANTVTVPPYSSVPFPIGTTILVAQYGAGQTSIVAGSGVTIRSAGDALGISSQYSCASLTKIAEDEWYLFGSISV